MITKKRFKALTKQWKDNTRNLSSVTCIAKHPAYREIVGMGEKAVPWILEELEKEPDQWFAALTEITGQNPIPQESMGKLDEMALAWLNWGEDRKWFKFTKKARDKWLKDNPY